MNNSLPISRQKLQTLKILYGTALAIIAFTIVSSWFLMHRALSENTGDSRVINLSGRQRMLSQRMSKCLLIMERDGIQSGGRFSELEESFRTFKKVHAGLRNGDTGLGLPRRSNSDEITRLFADIAPAEAAMENAIARALCIGPADPTFSACVDSVLAREQIYLPLMDKITFRFDTEAKERIRTMQLLESAILLFGLAVLLLEFLWVFRPSLRQIGFLITELEKRAKELSLSLAAQTTLTEAAHAARTTAEEAARTKGIFIATLSHEIRTPLNAIIGFSDLLGREIDNEGHRDTLHTISGAGKSLLHLVNETLDLARIESGKMSTISKPMHLADVLREVGELFRLGVEQKGLLLEIDIAPSVPPIIHMDTSHIRQILVNLIGNAVKFTEHGGVTVRVETPADPLKPNLVIAIADTGIGIPPDQQEQVFESFRQREGQNREQFGGSGLGLSISKQMIELLGGNITLQSDPGFGSTFTLTIPLPSDDTVGDNPTDTAWSHICICPEEPIAATSLLDALPNLSIAQKQELYELEPCADTLSRATAPFQFSLIESTAEQLLLRTTIPALSLFAEQLKTAAADMDIVYLSRAAKELKDLFEQFKKGKTRA